MSDNASKIKPSSLAIVRVMADPQLERHPLLYYPILVHRTDKKSGAFAVFLLKANIT
jgi:hypothetical protein